MYLAEVSIILGVSICDVAEISHFNWLVELWLIKWLIHDYQFCLISACSCMSVFGGLGCNFNSLPLGGYYACFTSVYVGAVPSDSWNNVELDNFLL